MDLFYVLLILLVTTRAFGEIAERLGQPSLVGELIAGITLGSIVAAYPDLFPGLVGLGERRRLRQDRLAREQIGSDERDLHVARRCDGRWSTSTFRGRNHARWSAFTVLGERHA